VFARRDWREGDDASKKKVKQATSQKENSPPTTIGNYH
jgi:hypothetical protein